MSVTLRGNKGAPLSHVELDGNFSGIEGRVRSLELQQFDGNYNSLANKPVLFSGNYNDLTNKPTLFNGNYDNLTNKPNLDQYLLTSAAFSGDYNDLLNKPSIFNGSYDNLTDKPNFATVAFTGSFDDLSDVPTGLTFSGSYNDLTDKPVLFSGSYNSLTDKPTIPADVADLTDNTNLLGGGSSFDQSLNTTDDVTFSNLTSTGVVAGVIGGFDDTPLNIETYAIDGESTVVNSWLFGTDGTITFPDSTVQTTAYTGSGDNPFDQDLNTSDAVTFASVNSSLFAAESNNQDLVIQTNEETFEGGEGEETATNANAVGNNYFSAVIASFPTITNVQAGWFANGLDLEVDSEVLSVSNDGTFFQIEINVSNGTFAFGESYTFTEPAVSTVTPKTWTFGYDNGSLEFPGGAVLDTQGPLSNSDFNITIPGEFALEPQTFSFTDEGGSGALKFPDGTYQYTAFSGGTPTELNDEENGNKLIIDSDGALVLTDASGTLESPSGGGSNRGLTWDYGEANGGSNSHILEQSGEGDILEIRAFVTSEIQAPVRLTAGSSGNPKSLDWTAEGKLQRNEDFLLSVAPGDSTESVWNFGTDGTTNIPGALAFPDGTTQTTAFATNEGVPLFVVVNNTGESSYSSDGVNWTLAGDLTFDGVGANNLSRVAIGKNVIVYIAAVPDGPDDSLFYSTDPGTSATSISFSLLTEAGNFTWRDVQAGGDYIVAVGNYYDVAEDSVIPVWAYTTNGANWTLGSVDPFYQALTGDGFSSVDYDGTGWFIVSEAGNGAGFYITDLSVTLAEDNYVSFTGLESPPGINSVVWTGNRWVVKDPNAGTLIFSSGTDPISSTWTAVDMAPIAYENGIINGWGDFYEDAGGTINGEHWYMIASSEGQVLATKDGGSTWIASSPGPWGGTIDTVRSTGEAVIETYTNNTEGVGWFGGLNDIEYITISNASPADYNGTYYARQKGLPDNLGTTSTSANWVPNTYTNVSVDGGAFIVTIQLLAGSPNNYINNIIVTNSGSTRYFVGEQFTILGSVLGGTDGVDDAVLTLNGQVTAESEWILYDTWDPDIGWSASTPIDWTANGAFVSADFNLNRGQYIDAAGFGLGKFIIGNDDEELYTTTDLETWTKVNDLDGAFDYWDDISFNEAFGATGVTTSRLTNGNFSATLNSDGKLTLPGALILPTAYPLDGSFEVRTALDLTKQVQVLTGANNDGFYTLADGQEGQIMYFTWLTNGIYILVANARIKNSGTNAVEVVNDYSWNIDVVSDSQEPRTIAMAIFVNGAWSLTGGVSD